MKFQYFIIASLFLILQTYSTALNKQQTCADAGMTASGVQFWKTTSLCVHKTCKDNFDQLVEIFSTTNNGVTVSYSGGDVTVTQVAQIQTCGAGGDQDCVTDGCYSAMVVKEQTDSDQLLSQVSAASFNFLLTNAVYTNVADAEAPCSKLDDFSNIYTCPFRIDYYYAGIDQFIISDKRFTVQINTDSQTAVLLDPVVPHTVVNHGSSIQPDPIVDTNGSGEGVIKRFAHDNFTSEITGDPLKEFSVGETVYLTLQVASKLDTGFDIAQTKLKWVKDSLEIDITPEINLSHQIDPSNYELRVAFKVSVLGTYELQLEGKHVSARRRLLDIEGQEQPVIKSQLRGIQVQEPKQQQQNLELQFVVVGIAVISMLSVYIGTTVKQIRKIKSEQLQKQSAEL